MTVWKERRKETLKYQINECKLQLYNFYFKEITSFNADFYEELNHNS